MENVDLLKEFLPLHLVPGSLLQKSVYYKPVDTQKCGVGKGSIEAHFLLLYYLLYPEQRDLVQFPPGNIFLAL